MKTILAPEFMLVLALATSGCQSLATVAPSTEAVPEATIEAAVQEAPPSAIARASGPARPAATPTVATPPLFAPTPYPATGCSAPATATELAADKQLLAKTAAAGLAVSVDRQCAGFSVFHQNGIDPGVIADYSEGATLAHNKLHADSGVTPPSVDFLVLSDTDQRRKAVGLLMSQKGSEELLQYSPAFAFGDTVWVDLSKSPARASRMSTAAHELTHVFVRTISANRPVPQWLNEGLAVYSETTIPAEREPAYVEGDAASRRQRVLDASAGQGPLPLFALDDLTSNKHWLDNYPNDDKRNLQYAQGYYTVKWMVDRNGLPAMWQLMKSMAVARFPDALPRTFSLTAKDLESQVKAAWSAETSNSVAPLHVSLRLSAGGVRPETRIAVRTKVNGKALRTVTPALSAGEYAFEVLPSGQVTDAAGVLKLQTDESAPLVRDGMAVTVASANYRGADGTAPRGNEQVTYWLAYGRWSPAQVGREFYPIVKDGKTEFLRGALTDPFPDGNSIAVAAKS
ncbi:MAG TPA: hypothetical protein VF157_09270 [Chloroflexota bacterium]